MVVEAIAHSVRIGRAFWATRKTLERGQAATEYLALIVLVTLGCSFIIRTLPVAVQGYLRPFYFVISKPYP